ncbi:unnamed protein product [Prorocentrum cordatum]|uniref:Uncharacterized protein n=1 Tax=Prorocentrum cordatum TaxID=2364126 RepID=A0ABN9RKZ8_9DINO|nr:unnamed protein product [Polarella glacialis]
MQGQDGSRSPAPAAAARSSPGGDDEPGAGRCCDGAPGRAEAVDDGDPWTALDKLIEIGGHPPPAQQADDGLLDLEKGLRISSRQAKRQPPRTRAPLPPPQVDATAESSAVAPQGRSGSPRPRPAPASCPLRRPLAHLPAGRPAAPLPPGARPAPRGPATRGRRPRPRGPWRPGRRGPSCQRPRSEGATRGSLGARGTSGVT